MATEGLGEVQPLGEPPHFGADGRWPPVEGPPTVVSTASFVVEFRAAGPPRFAERLDPGERSVVAESTLLLGPLGILAWLHYKNKHRAGWTPSPVPARSEVREVVHTQRWRREDPIVQLPPGASCEHSYTTECGITNRETSELAANLGIDIGAPLGSRSTQLSAKCGIEVSLTEQRRVTSTLRLRNDEREVDRLYAVWLVQHDISIHRVDAAFARTLLHRTTYRPAGAAAVVSSCEVRRHAQTDHVAQPAKHATPSAAWSFDWYTGDDRGLAQPTWFSGGPLTAH